MEKLPEDNKQSENKNITKEKGFLEKLLTFNNKQKDKKKQFAKRAVPKDAYKFKEMSQVDDTPRLGADGVNYTKNLIKAIEAD